MLSRSKSGLFAVGALVILGTYWAYSRGGNDFNVFYAAWDHVLQGSGAEVYRKSPDRFLYAPGFAWIFSPLALFPRDAALALWCFLKAGIIGWMIREFSQPGDFAGLTAWATFLVARPILIDFEYGQVNLLILGACVWALVRHLKHDPDEPFWDFISWFFLGVAAIGKIFPAPLLAVPFFVTSFAGTALSSRKLKAERWGAFAGVALILALPMVTQGWGGTIDLMQQWRVALIDRGFPLESHNQSFGAFLIHYTSGLPTEIIAQHRRPLTLGYPIFAQETIRLLSVAWSLFFAGCILSWILVVPRSRRISDLGSVEAAGARYASYDRWLAILVGLIILPSHLVWKPYFVLGLPAAFLAMRRLRSSWPWILSAFLLMNLTGFDFLGKDRGAGFEAASTMLWAHLLLVWVMLDRFFKSRQLFPSRALGSS